MAEIIVGCLLPVLTRRRSSEHTLFIADSQDVSRVVGIDVDREKIKTSMRFFCRLSGDRPDALKNKNFFRQPAAGVSFRPPSLSVRGGPGRCGHVRIDENFVQGLILLVSIIFYVYADETRRRRALFANQRSFGGFGAVGTSKEEEVRR